jgi:hypothetical protein
LSIKVTAIATKELFHNENFYIISFNPIREYPSELKLSKYNSFVCKGELAFITIGKQYNLIIEEGTIDKYGVSYIITDIPYLKLDEITDDIELDILKEITTDSQAKYVHTAYPNFVRLILDGKEDEIDLKKIHNVGEVRFKIYKKLINLKFKYFYLKQKYKEYHLAVNDCKELYKAFLTEDEINKALQETPYNALINHCGWGFKATDHIITSIREDLINSEQRLEFAMLDVLNRNEFESNTRILGNVAYGYLKDEYGLPQELLNKVVDICDKSNLIYYDKETKYLAKMSTWIAENTIANFIDEKMNNNIVLNWEWDKFKEIKDGTLTDEQSNVLKMVCENNFVILNAPAGCVDKDTEYFNGKGWTKISKYDGGEVLQWNKDGTANMVQPYRYIKEPCDMMYHFETKYGLDQTLSAEHRVVYYTDYRGKFTLRECTMEELYDKQINGCGFSGKFITTFNYSGKGINLTDSEIKIMCAVICDGSFYYNKEKTEDVCNRNSYKTCRFHIKKERKKIALRKLFEESNLDYREVKSSAEGYTDFYIQAPRREKEFTEFWYDCNQHQLQIICDNLMQWDGSINFTPNNVRRERFSTNVLSTANFVQFAYTTCGYRVTINVMDRRGRIKINKNTNKQYIDKTIEYCVGVTKRTSCSLCFDKRYTHINTNITKVETKDGYKYCFSVPSSYLVLRRNNKIFITGNCGKSSAMKAVLQMIEHYHKSYKCVSFTGKASKRLSEQTDRPAQTIHSLCSNGEIHTEWLLVDECSMLSVDLMAMIINSLKNSPNTRILLIGDSSQIPSISTGRVMKDIIESNKVPICTLTKCFRFKQGGMAMVSTMIRNGEFYLDDNIEDEVIMGENKDYKFVRFNNTVEQIVDEYAKLINKGIKKEDITIISPMNKYEFGAININNHIQEYINPPQPNEEVVVYENKATHTKIVFRAGDIVMNTKNNYNCLKLDGYETLKEDDTNTLTSEDVGCGAVFNGEIGKVLNIENGKMKIQFNESIFVFDKTDARHLLLGYCSNPFKLQGSQNKWIIVLTIEEHKRMLNRQLQYTSETRASDGVVEIGEIKTMKNCVNTLGDDNRDTYLKDLLLNQKNI